MLRIGVLSLQGSVIEHLQSLKRLEGITPLEIKSLEGLQSVDGLILPGGESTTMGKLLRDFKLFEPLQKRIKEGMPVWGTCAGLILLAEKIADDETVHLGTLKVTVRRNAYGSQLNSFTTKKLIPEVSSEAIHMVFIRAPWVEKAAPDVQILAQQDEKIVAVKQDNMLGTSFHPELTDDLDFHHFFVEMCRYR